jgi:hypothetical protein
MGGTIVPGEVFVPCNRSAHQRLSLSEYGPSNRLRRLFATSGRWSSDNS